MSRLCTRLSISLPLAGMILVMANCAEQDGAVTDAQNEIQATHAQATTQPSLRLVLDFDIDDAGNIGIIGCVTEPEFVFAVMHPAGRMSEPIPIPYETPRDLGLPTCLWLGEDHWLVATGPMRNAPSVLVWPVNVTTRSVEGPIGYDFERMDWAVPIARDGHGGFVAYNTVSAPVDGIVRTFKFGEIIAFDFHGMEKWRRSDERSGTEFRWPYFARIAATASQILLLDLNSLHVLMFDSTGRYRDTVFSDEFRVCTPYMGLDFFSDFRDRVLFHDPFNGMEVQVVLDGVTNNALELAGEATVCGVKRKRPISTTTGKSREWWERIRIAPDGTTWGRRGLALFRITEDGKWEHVLGDVH